MHFWFLFELLSVSDSHEIFAIHWFKTIVNYAISQVWAYILARYFSVYFIFKTIYFL